MPAPAFSPLRACLQRRQSVYFQWDAGDRAGAWTIRIDTPSDNHDFDLFGRDDQGSRWDDRDRSNDGDERITFTVQSCGHLYIRVMNCDCGAPTELTITIEPPNGGKLSYTNRYSFEYRHFGAGHTGC